MSLYGEKFKIGGLSCGLVLRGGANGEYRVVFEREYASLEQIEALEWLRQIEAAVRKSYSEAKALVEAFEETGLESSLPTQSSVEGAEAPADTYRQIYAMLF